MAHLEDATLLSESDRSRSLHRQQLAAHPPAALRPSPERGGTPGNQPIATTVHESISLADGSRRERNIVYSDRETMQLRRRLQARDVPLHDRRRWLLLRQRAWVQMLRSQIKVRQQGHFIQVRRTGGAGQTRAGADAE